MRRRSLIVALFAMALGANAAEAQPTDKIASVGYLSHGLSPALEALQEGLRTLGWVEGSNLVVEYRWSYHRTSESRSWSKTLSATVSILS